MKNFERTPFSSSFCKELLKNFPTAIKTKKLVHRRAAFDRKKKQDRKKYSLCCRKESSGYFRGRLIKF